MCAKSRTMIVWPCGDGALHGAVLDPVGVGVASFAGEGCCWSDGGIDVVVEDVAMRGWGDMAADGAMFSFCARGPTEDGLGDDESGGDGKREAPPPLDKAGF